MAVATIGADTFSCPTIVVRKSSLEALYGVEITDKIISISLEDSVKLSKIIDSEMTSDMDQDGPYVWCNVIIPEEDQL